MIKLILYFLISHFLSFLCSILESVLLCMTNGYVALLKKRSPHVGTMLYELKQRIDRPLAAILTLNTASHTFGAAGVGAQVVALYGDWMLGITSAIFTLTMLYFTEMIPKTLGALYWRKLAVPAAYIIKCLITITYPFVISFEWVAHLLAPKKHDEKVTGEEIKYILEEGTQAGVLKEIEYDMVDSIFKLGSRRINALMIPRMDIEWLDINEDKMALTHQMKKSPHTRFPLCNDELDQIIGIISSKDILHAVLEKNTFNLKEIAKPPLFVPENMFVLQLLDLFKKRHDHMAIVADEYGGIQGLITLHDVLESIIGDVPASSTFSDHQAVHKPDGSWIFDGMVLVDEFQDYLAIETILDEDKNAYRTLGGFCMYQIGAIPKVGDSFNWRQFEFKIIQMDGKRVEKVMVRPIK